MISRKSPFNQINKPKKGTLRPSSAPVKSDSAPENELQPFKTIFKQIDEKGVKSVSGFIWI